jgi:hypothetical protein
MARVAGLWFLTQPPKTIPVEMLGSPERIRLKDRRSKNEEEAI